HPYPSLLDPNKLKDINEELNYHSIDANLAWELNLPLPDNYEFIGLFLHANGETALSRFLIECGLNLFYVFENTGRMRYVSIFNFVLEINNRQAIILLDLNCSEISKFAYLSNCRPLMVLLRDPIDCLKSFLNVRHQLNGYGNIPRFDLNCKNFYQIQDRINYVHEKNGYYNPNSLQRFPEINAIKAILEPNHSMIKYMFKRDEFIQAFKKEKIYYIDMNEILKQKTYFTLEKLSKKFNFNAPDKNNKIFSQKIYSVLTILLPVILEVNYKKIYISNRFSSKALPAIKNYFDFTKECENVFDENIIIFMDNKEYDLLYKNLKLYKEVLNWISLFLKSLKERIVQEQQKEIKVCEVLEYFYINKQEALQFKNILDYELTHIKEHRPDIIASWKYYEEFERMCQKIK
ncbi:DUF2972 domain-containing protein, partial [Campylobacter novaezeelandiae]